MAAPEPVRLERLPPFAWAVIAVVALSVLSTILQIVVVRPYLWPAGARRTPRRRSNRAPADQGASADIRKDFASPLLVVRVAPGSPAADDRLAIAAGNQAIEGDRSDRDRFIACRASPRRFGRRGLRACADGRRAAAGAVAAILPHGRQGAVEWAILPATRSAAVADAATARRSGIRTLTAGRGGISG